MTILITGSSGKTAAYLAKALVASNHPLLVASRAPKPNSANPTTRFDWLDEKTWDLPFSHEQAKGSPITAVYLVSPDQNEARAQVMPFVKHAIQEGVRRFVLLSAWEVPEGGDLLGRAHAELKALGSQGIEWAVLRPHFFMENFSETYHLETIRSEGKIYTATANGKKPFISARDIAAVAAVLLTGEKLKGADWIITGSESLSYDDVASTFSEGLGRKVEHVKLSAEDFTKFLMKHGMDEQMAKYMADLDVRVSSGEGEQPTENVKGLTGHSPWTFKDFVTENKSWWEQ